MKTQTKALFAFIVYATAAGVSHASVDVGPTAQSVTTKVEVKAPTGIHWNIPVTPTIESDKTVKAKTVVLPNLMLVSDGEPVRFAASLGNGYTDAHGDTGCVTSTSHGFTGGSTGAKVKIALCAPNASYQNLGSSGNTGVATTEEAQSATFAISVDNDTVFQADTYTAEVRGFVFNQ